MSLDSLTKEYLKHGGTVAQAVQAYGLLSKQSGKKNDELSQLGVLCSNFMSTNKPKIKKNLGAAIQGYSSTAVRHQVRSVDPMPDNCRSFILLLVGAHPVTEEGNDDSLTRQQIVAMCVAEDRWTRGTIECTISTMFNKGNLLECVEYDDESFRVNLTQLGRSLKAKITHRS